jgi:hypothetical protein
MLLTLTRLQQGVYCGIGNYGQPYLEPIFSNDHPSATVRFLLGQKCAPLTSGQSGGESNHLHPASL